MSDTEKWKVNDGGSRWKQTKTLALGKVLLNVLMSLSNSFFLQDLPEMFPPTLLCIPMWCWFLELDHLPPIPQTKRQSLTTVCLTTRLWGSMCVCEQERDWVWLRQTTKTHLEMLSRNWCKNKCSKFSFSLTHTNTHTPRQVEMVKYRAMDLVTKAPVPHCHRLIQQPKPTSRH